MTRSSWGLVLLGVMTVIMVLIGAAEITRVLNSRTEARINADEATTMDIIENRRIIDELVCEVRALRRAAAERGFDPSVPNTQPRVTEEFPCPPQR